MAEEQELFLAATWALELIGVSEILNCVGHQCLIDPLYRSKRFGRSFSMTAPRI